MKNNGILHCPVRDCHQPLARKDRSMACPNGHSFDIARSGYINLLQPQDRRSKNPGDTPEAVAARRRLHDRGVTQPLLNGISEMISASKDDIVLDAGCGEGFYLGNLAQRFGFSGHGVDISTRAIGAAAKRYPECEWIVANADRFLPYADDSFSIVMSITGRMNSAEFRRVLHKDGRLLVAIPAPDDLIELRRGGSVDKAEINEDRDRVERTVQNFAPLFTLTNRQRVTTTADLDADAVHDILHSIYRPLRSQPVQAMSVTFSLDVLEFRVT
jgi:23S rRNA (guanine745-N1)-methyltransferase